MDDDLSVIYPRCELGLPLLVPRAVYPCCPSLRTEDEMTGYIYNGCYQIEADFDPFTTLSQINAMTPTVS